MKALAGTIEGLFLDPSTNTAQATQTLKHRALPKITNRWAGALV